MKKKRSATGGEMPFTVHLGELRGRLIRSLVAMAVAFCLCYAFAERLLYFLWLPAGRELVFIAPTEAFFAHLKVAFLASLVLVWPYLCYQAWAFVVPGLYEKERRYMVPFVVSATFMFLLGGAFVYTLILPYGMAFLLGYGSAALVPMIRSALTEAVIDDIGEKHEQGRPVLVGTVAIETSEHLSELLERRGVRHEVLNAKQHSREATIVARAGVALYTVGARKEVPGATTYVSVDGGMADNVRPAMYESRYEVLVANRALEPPAERVHIAGRYCESGDVLVDEARLPPPEPGDLIALPASGAYCIPMASNYNMAVRPAVVMVRDGEARIIRRRETYDDILATSMV